MNSEKPSTTQQWQEKVEKPIAARPMTTNEIEEFRQILIKSYRCEDSDITFNFQKIQDEQDEDRDDMLLLKYMMPCIISGKRQLREIFTTKLPIPEELRRQAKEIQRQQAAAGRTRPPPAPGPHNQLVPAEIKKPVIKKPIRAKSRINDQ